MTAIMMNQTNVTNFRQYSVRCDGPKKRTTICLKDGYTFLVTTKVVYIVLYLTAHGLLIEYGPICHIVKLPISMIRPFSLVNNSHITLYPQLEIIWKVSKSLRKYWGEIWTNLILYYKLYNARLYYS